MNKIYFPSSYKTAILKKTKNSTIRVDKEIGKYKKGHSYNAFSYSEADWKTKIKILEVNKITINELSKFKIPSKSIKSLKQKTSLEDKDTVELIKFKYI